MDYDYRTFFYVQYLLAIASLHHILGNVESFYQLKSYQNPSLFIDNYNKSYI